MLQRKPAPEQEEPALRGPALLAYVAWGLSD
jgi:hypothetical protein